MNILEILLLDVVCWSAFLLFLMCIVGKRNFPKNDISNTVKDMLFLSGLPLKGWEIELSVLDNLILWGDERWGGNQKILVTFEDRPKARLYKDLKFIPKKVIYLNDNLSLQFEVIKNIMVQRNQNCLSAHEFELIAY